jgi:glycerol-3-phosphate dehydrogenase (NAD(P)+)
LTTVVLGAGSWGTIFAKLLADAGQNVTIWARRPEIAKAISENGSNPDYFPDIRLPSQVTATSDPLEALESADLVALAIPSQTLRANLTAWVDAIPQRATLISLMKGIELGTGKRMSQVIVETTGVSPDRVAVVSGPNLAGELARQEPAATVVACPDPQRATQVQRALRSSYMRTYGTTDVIGCELGGSVKNVIALAYGMAVSLGLGSNTRATLLTRGLAETARLGDALGADPLTFAGLAGLGDLVATCDSPLSRNRTFGEHLGRGETLEQAQTATRETAEGVKSCRAIRELALRHGVDMPITEQVELVCHQGVDPRRALAALMGREMKHSERQP